MTGCNCGSSRLHVGSFICSCFWKSVCVFKKKGGFHIASSAHAYMYTQICIRCLKKKKKKEAGFHVASSAPKRLSTRADIHIYIYVFQCVAVCCSERAAPQHFRLQCVAVCCSESAAPRHTRLLYHTGLPRLLDLYACMLSAFVLSGGGRENADNSLLYKC